MYVQQTLVPYSTTTVQCIGLEVSKFMQKEGLGQDLGYADSAGTAHCRHPRRR